MSLKSHEKRYQDIGDETGYTGEFLHPIKGKLLLSIYDQLCVVQYGEIGR